MSKAGLPQLCVEPSVLDFGEEEVTLPVEVTNCGTGGVVNWTASVDRPWMSIDTSSGSTSDEADIINVTVDRYALPFGTYDGTLTIDSDAGTAAVQVLMTVGPQHAVNAGGYLKVDFIPEIAFIPDPPYPGYYIDIYPLQCPGIGPDSCEVYRYYRDCSYGEGMDPTLPPPPEAAATDPPWINWICAVFPDTTCVEISRVDIGITRVQGNMTFVDYGHKGIDEATTEGWPGPGEGITIWFDPPLTSHVVPLLWISGYPAPEAKVYFGGKPGEDAPLFYGSNPNDPPEAAVEPFPISGWFLDGLNPDTSHLPVMRVCCVGTECLIVTEQECSDMGGTWLPDELWCDPNPCE